MVSTLFLILREFFAALTALRSVWKICPETAEKHMSELRSCVFQ